MTWCNLEKCASPCEIAMQALSRHLCTAQGNKAVQRSKPKSSPPDKRQSVRLVRGGTRTHAHACIAHAHIHTRIHATSVAPKQCDANPHHSGSYWTVLRRHAPPSKRRLRTMRRSSLSSCGVTLARSAIEAVPRLPVESKCTTNVSGISQTP